MAELNPNIILAGQPLNLLGIMDQTNRMAGETLDRRHQQDYRNMLATNGAGIVAGEQNALNALAGYDPQAALTVQDTRLGMDAQRQRMSILSAQEARATAEYAAGLTAQQRAAEAAQLEDAVKMGMMIPDAATWDQTMATMAPDLVGQFGNRQSLAAKYMSMAEVLKMANPEPVDPLEGAPSGYMWTQPGNPGAGVAPIPGMPVEAPQLPYDVPPGYMPVDPSNPMAGVAPIPGYAAKPADDYGRYVIEEQAAGRMPLSRLEFEQAKKGAGFSVTTPDGTTVQYGEQKAIAPKLTEQQSKDLTYWQRATGASDAVDKAEGALANFGDKMSSSVPYAGNYMVSPEFQQGQQAASEWLSAILRKDTGAAITKQEFDIYGPMYLPQPGDSEAVIKQKREARKRAEDGIRLGLGTAEVLAQEVDRRRGGSSGSGWTPAEDMPAPEGVDPADWKYMTPEERAIFQ